MSSTAAIDPSVPSPAPPSATIDPPKRVTTAWLNREVPTMSPSSFQLLLDMLVKRGWTDEEIQERVLPLRSA